MASQNIKVQVGRIIINLDRIERISMNGQAGAMYEPTVSTPDATWTRLRVWRPKKMTDAQILESEWMERFIQAAVEEFPEFAKEDEKPELWTVVLAPSGSGMSYSLDRIKNITKRL